MLLVELSEELFLLAFLLLFELCGPLVLAFKFLYYDLRSRSLALVLEKLGILRVLILLVQVIIFLEVIIVILEPQADT